MPTGVYDHSVFIGRKFSEERRINIGLAKKGKCLGKHHSKKTKNKISQSLKGRSFGYKFPKGIVPTNKTPIEIEKKIIELYKREKLYSMRKIARTIGVSSTVVRNVLKRNDIRIRSVSELQSGENNPYWRGGKIVSEGYISILSNGKYKALHKIIMENSLGRSLNDGEIVHHIDLDKRNNQILNLHLLPTSKEHKIVHQSLDKVIIELIKNHIILFDKEKNLYRIGADTRTGL